MPRALPELPGVARNVSLTLVVQTDCLFSGSTQGVAVSHHMTCDLRRQSLGNRKQQLLPKVALSTCGHHQLPDILTGNPTAGL